MLYQSSWVLKSREWGFCEGFLAPVAVRSLLDKREWRRMEGVEWSQRVEFELWFEVT